MAAHMKHSCPAALGTDVSVVRDEPGGFDVINIAPNFMSILSAIRGSVSKCNVTLTSPSESMDVINPASCVQPPEMEQQY